MMAKNLSAAPRILNKNIEGIRLLLIGVIILVLNFFLSLIGITLTLITKILDKIIIIPESRSNLKEMK